MNIDGCYYVSAFGLAFGWTQSISTAFSLFLSVITLITHEPLFFFYGWYLQGAQMVLWSIQLVLRVDRIDPICAQYHTYAFPSVESYYVASAVTFAIAYSFIKEYNHSVIMWLVFEFCFVVPAVTLVWFQYNLWWEVAISMALGIVVTLIFIAYLFLYIEPSLGCLQLVFPLQWLGYRDSLILSEKEQQQCTEMKRSLQRVLSCLRQSWRSPLSYLLPS